MKLRFMENNEMVKKITTIGLEYGEWKKEGVMDTSGVSSYNAIFAYFCDKNKLS